MTDDIVSRLRDCTCVPHGEICREAADEIERLRAELVSTTNKLTAERDEARRLWCIDIGELYSSSPMSLAKERGWDCFKEKL